MKILASVIIVIIVLLFLTIHFMMVYYKRKTNNLIEGRGFSAAEMFLTKSFAAPLPFGLDDEYPDKEVLRLSRKHDKIVKIYWILLAGMIVCIVLMGIFSGHKGMS